MQPACFAHPHFPDYALVDSGEGEKLERFGSVTLRRPDPQALWRRRARPDEWERADLTFVRESDRGGRWEPSPRTAAPREGAQWSCRFGDAKFLVRPTPFKHVGVFPEQAANWVFLQEQRKTFGPESPRLLNLFGYAGAASVVAALAGYSVTHVDASKTTIAWARENAEASGLARDSLRVLCDDALAFARREARRGAHYEAILLDPPHYGRGPRGEKWRFETGIAPLIEAAGALLAERSLLVLSSYAIGYSPLAFVNLLNELEGGTVEAGELALPEGDGERLLPAGFCARWTRGLER